MTTARVLAGALLFLSFAGQARSGDGLYISLEGGGGTVGDWEHNRFNRADCRLVKAISWCTGSPAVPCRAGGRRNQAASGSSLSEAALVQITFCKLLRCRDAGDFHRFRPQRHVFLQELGELFRQRNSRAGGVDELAQRQLALEAIGDQEVDEFAGLVLVPAGVMFVISLLIARTLELIRNPSRD